MELEAGDILEGREGKWEILRFLSKGKCCSVYEASRDGERTCRERRAALKLYKKNDKYTSAGMNEVRILQRICLKTDVSSLFIVKLLDFFHCDGHLCLLNPLLLCNLDHILTKKGWPNGLPMYVVQKCCRELTCGLAYLRQNRIIHGDIKPTNIMWDSEMEVFQFVDFGLSFTDGKQPAQQIQSPNFQAPEAQEWNGNVATPFKTVEMCSYPCDTWSTACVIYHLYTCHSLFPTEIKLPHICYSCHQGDSVNCIHSKAVQDQLLQHLSRTQHVCSKDHLEALSDVLLRMVKCRATDRLTPSMVLNHRFLSPQLTITNPTLADLLCLPTRVLQLTNMFEDASEIDQSEEFEDFIDDIKEECSRFGVVKSVRVPCIANASSNTDYLGKNLKMLKIAKRVNAV